VLDTRIPDGLRDIRAGWSLDDICHAHDFLDELDRARARQEAAARASELARQQGRPR
jgi:hypothetical protein